MASTLRTPSRIRKSELRTKNAGWPASEGILSIFELPSSPWHPAHSAMRSCSVAAWLPVAAKARAAASPRARGRHGCVIRVITSTMLASSPGRVFGRRLVADAVGRAIGLVGDEQRAVLHREDVGRPAVELVLLVIEQA